MQLFVHDQVDWQSDSDIGKNVFLSFYLKAFHIVLLTHHLFSFSISVYYNDEWQLRYVRQCAPSGIVGGDEGRRCLEKTGTYKVKVRICHCDNQEGCNGASNIHSNIHVILLPLMTIVYVKYLWTW